MSEKQTSYERLFYNGNNKENARKIGNMLTYMQSQTIKQGNLLEKYINEFVNEKTQNNILKESKTYFKNKPSFQTIFENKTIMNKCFIPKKYFEEYNIPCANKEGIEIDYVIIDPEKGVSFIELKSGKNFDTKKSKDEIDNLMNIKQLCQFNHITVNELLFTCYGATDSNDICLKTDLKDVKKTTFKYFLKLFLNDKETNEAIEYIDNNYKDRANENLEYLLSMNSDIFKENENKVIYNDTKRI